jgi:hypothetical protein
MEIIKRMEKITVEKNGVYKFEIPIALRDNSQELNYFILPVRIMKLMANCSVGFQPKTMIHFWWFLVDQFGECRQGWTDSQWKIMSIRFEYIVNTSIVPILNQRRVCMKYDNHVPAEPSNQNEGQEVEVLKRKKLQKRKTM